MASRREEHQAEIRLKVMRLISQNPEMSTRQVADEVGVSNGSAYYVLTALVEKGFVKLGNFKKNPRKGQYAYVLTPKGIREKSLLTHSFIERKHEEFEVLRAEIKALKEEAGLATEAKGEQAVTELTCFKAYDIRGEISVNIDEDIAYRIGRAVAQQFTAKSVVIGFDARATSPVYAAAAARGAMDAGADVLDIAIAGTEEMYWAVTEFGACAGIEVTASHNPINYNGMKIVKSGSRPLDDVEDFQKIKALAASQAWTEIMYSGQSKNIATEARQKYVNQVISFVDTSRLAPLKVVINSGNGAAGPTVDTIIDRLTAQGAPIEFIRVQHEPDSTFPNGIPNPLLAANHAATADVVMQEGADVGVAFDGDFDRCFFFDELGKFVPGEYVVGLLAEIFLEKEPGSKIVHDPRVIWNTQDIVAVKGGKAVQSKTGHAFMKQTMRTNEAIYGGEMSAHHYFRDFAYCDSGMIPWLLVVELVSQSGRSLADWVSNRFEAFPSSGEINFRVDDAGTTIERVLDAYRADALSIDETDGVSLAFENWRFNLRRSNTEPLVRLNVESKVSADTLDAHVSAIAELLGGTRA